MKFRLPFKMLYEMFGLVTFSFKPFYTGNYDLAASHAIVKTEAYVP